MTNNPESMKNIVETIVKGLKAQGINVDSAAILNIPGAKNNPVQEKKISDIVDEVLGNIGKMGFPIGSPKPSRGLDNEASDMRKVDTQAANQAKDPEQCYCPNCFNFETFESVLTPRGGTFDYATVKLGGKEFDIKFWSDGQDDNLMISPRQPKFEPQGTLEELQIQLNQAVQERAYDKAQALITLINNIKNQKGGN